MDKNLSYKDTIPSKEKAKELYGMMREYQANCHDKMESCAQGCALIIVREIMKDFEDRWNGTVKYEFTDHHFYWKEVEEHIQNLELNG